MDLEILAKKIENIESSVNQLKDALVRFCDQKTSIGSPEDYLTCTEVVQQYGISKFRQKKARSNGLSFSIKGVRGICYKRQDLEKYIEVWRY